MVERTVGRKSEREKWGEQMTCKGMGDSLVNIPDAQMSMWNNKNGLRSSPQWKAKVPIPTLVNVPFIDPDHKGNSVDNKERRGLLLRGNSTHLGKASAAKLLPAGVLNGNDGASFWRVAIKDLPRLNVWKTPAKVCKAGVDLHSTAPVRMSGTDIIS
jgi:hypothetical protein